MSKFMKKAATVGLAVSTAIWLSGAAAIVPSASAQVTTADLQAQIAQLLAQIAQLQAQLNASGGTTGGTMTTACNFTRDLTLGSTGDDAKCLQEFLNANGFQVAASGVGSPGSETTYFGTLTKNALSKWQAANSVSPAVGYFGPISRSKYSSVAAVVVTPPTTGGTTGGTTTPPPAGVTIPSDGIAITLASDNPAGKAVPKGASGLTFLKFNLAGTGEVDTLVFKREGIGATADFNSSSINLLDGEKRLSSGKTINSTTHEISFPNLNIELNNEVKTLTLIGDIAAGATAGNRNSFSIVSATGDPSPTVTGVTGNQVEIAGQVVGGLVATSTAAPSNPRVGQKEALLQSFKLTASSTEDVLVEKIALVETGTIQNDRLSNFKLKVAGDTVATADAVEAKDLVTFVFDEPYEIEKGQERTFDLYGDITGKARSGDTIIFRFDTASDIRGIGQLYGYPVVPDIAGMDADAEVDTLTLDGGQVTITFNGPIAGDVPLRGQDITVFDFTLATQNEIEIKNLRFHASTTGLASGEGFLDMKVWDVEQNAIVTSASDITTSSDVTFTDTINMSAGESRRYKVTVDVDADNDDGDDIQVRLDAFQSGDIKNLDNNNNVATTDIVPNAAVVGNLQDTRVPTVTVGLAAAPNSRTYVRGAQNVSLLGFTLRASGGDVIVKTIKTTSTATGGTTLGTGEVTGLALYDGETKISRDVDGVIGTDYSSTFSSLNLKIKKGETKLITLKGNVSSDADANDIYEFQILGANSTYLTVTDAEGNSATIAGDAVNTGNNVAMTIANTGDVTVTKVNDSETNAGVVVAGKEAILAKFTLETIREPMIVQEMELLVAATSTATATSTTAVNTAPTLKLYDGTTLLGTYTVQNSGASSGIAIVNNLNWTVPIGRKTLTVKAPISSISECTVGSCTGGDTGESIWVQLLTTGFKANGQTASDETPATAAIVGNEKVAYRSVPTLTALDSGSTFNVSGAAELAFKFRVSADSSGPIEWKKAQFKVSMTHATMSAASTTNVKLVRDGEGTGNALTLSTVYSGSTASAATTATITGGATGFVSVELQDGSEEEIAAGSSQVYELWLTFTDPNTTSGNKPKVAISLNRQESAPITNGTWYAGVAGAAVDTDMNPSFIWSDISATNHSSSTADWTSGVYIKDFDVSKVLE